MRERGGVGGWEWSWGWGGMEEEDPSSRQLQSSLWRLGRGANTREGLVGDTCQLSN